MDKNVANNILALVDLKRRSDPTQKDDEIFKTYFNLCLVDEFKNAYGIDIKYGSYDYIDSQVRSIFKKS